MKKTFGKLAAFVLAFLMIFSLTGCGMVKVENSTKALAGAVDAMLSESSVSATATISAKIGEEINLQGLIGELALSKGQNDYNYSADFKMKSGSMTVSMFSQIKKDDKIYTRALGEQLYAVDSTSKISTEELGDTLKDFINNLDLSALKKDGKTYVISVANDYAAAVNAFISGILAVKDEDAGDYLCTMLGVNETQLETFINSAFADDVTLSGTINAVNTLLASLAPSDSAITVEALMTGIDAETVYSALSMLDYTVAAPTATQTGYSYLISVWGNKKLDDILALLDGLGDMFPDYGNDDDWNYGDDEDWDFDFGDDDNWGYGYGDDDDEYWGYGYSLYAEDYDSALTVAELRETIKEALGLGESDGATIGDLYDYIAESFDFFAEMIIGTLGSSDALNAMTVVAMANDSALLCVKNLKNITANKLGYSVKVVLNGKDLTFKSIDVAVDCDVKYNNYKVAYADVDVNVVFNYDKVSISAPAQSLIAQ